MDHVNRFNYQIKESLSMNLFNFLVEKTRVKVASTDGIDDYINANFVSV